MLAYVNGTVLPEEEAVVSINDRGWLYGDAVFETLRTYGGRLFKLSEHLKRLEQSAQLIGLLLPLPLSSIGEAMETTIAEQMSLNANDNEVAGQNLEKRPKAPETAKDDLMVRVTVSRGVGGSGLFPARSPGATIVIHLRELPDYPLETFSLGWSAIISKTRRNNPAAVSPRVKSTSFLNNVLAKREAVEAGVNEALMLNEVGNIAESSVSNFFMVKDGHVLTPPVADGILPGITRDSVLRLAREAMITAKEAHIGKAEAYSADEAFLTLTSAGIIPLVSIDGRALGTGRPGPVTERLRKLYNRYIEEWKLT